ncbi:hypothetical protein GCM10012285_64580 [Streptomyces kronopolitis]|uniref:Uncharacterized protein n=1 Tax=Streptomyces kronopolitis TaxID=1612435 RepID=A0ABQ2K355_9ACTN|nr:hypothetical protein GCM10012285_64580 [Streptomyces kronopolitis]GLW14033.1 hypothetical protein Stsp01_07760 [Streptomyces sp. NBRC 13847]
MNSGMTGNSAPTSCAVNATIIAKSAASCTARRGTIPAEGTGEGSWQHEGQGEAERGGRVPRCDAAGAAKRDRWTPDRMTSLALVTICCGSHHRESGPIERNPSGPASV